MTRNFASRDQGDDNGNVLMSVHDEGRPVTQAEKYTQNRSVP